MHRILARLHFALFESWPLFCDYLISETRISSLEVRSISALFSLGNPRWRVVAVIQVVVKLPSARGLLHYCFLESEGRLLTQQSLAFHLRMACDRHLDPFTHVLRCNNLVRLNFTSRHSTLTDNTLKSMVPIVFSGLELRLISLSLLIELQKLLLPMFLAERVTSVFRYVVALYDCSSCLLRYPGGSHFQGTCLTRELAGRMTTFATLHWSLRYGLLSTLFFVIRHYTRFLEFSNRDRAPFVWGKANDCIVFSNSFCARWRLIVSLLSGSHNFAL